MEQALILYTESLWQISDTKGLTTLCNNNKNINKSDDINNHIKLARWTQWKFKQALKCHFLSYPALLNPIWHRYDLVIADW